MKPIPITPKKNIYNNWNELLMKAGTTYEIRRYITQDIVMVTSENGERAMPRQWLVTAEALTQP